MFCGLLLLLLAWPGVQVSSSRPNVSWPTTVSWPLASQPRAVLYGAASTITWSYSLDVLYVSYMTWYPSSAESSGAKRERSERVRR